MFKNSCEFIKGVTKMDDLPTEELPEVAFVGRSNVGKSSLVNALLHNRKMARTSNTPGRTQQLNFFNLDDSIMLVDLPGYGFAKASKTDIRKWNKLVNSYLKCRLNLRRVFILVDSRHGIKDNDREMMSMLDVEAVSYQIVLTKSDKLKEKQVEKVISSVKEATSSYTALFPELVVTSAGKGRGLGELRNIIHSFV